jgi:hypothetical protein
MRILLVSQMYPGPADPDLGVFVADLERALAERGHEIARAVLDRRAGGKLRYLALARATRERARRFRPDVVYAHFLVPSGLVAALAGRAPLIVTAHGRDVRNVGAIPGIAWLTRWTLRRAAGIIAVSRYLARELEQKVPEARGRVDVVDCGVDLERFRPRDQAEARRELRWSGDGPLFLCVGSLDERKNVERLAAAFARFGRGSLVFVGDGPLRAALEWKGATVIGRVPHLRVGAARGACMRQAGSRDAPGRAARVRSARGRRARRSRRRGRAGRGARSRCRASRPERGSPRGRRGARAQPSGAADRGDPPASRASSLSLSSTSGRTLSSSPASRATASACS